jgi:hypothetical protein
MNLLCDKQYQGSISKQNCIVLKGLATKQYVYLSLFSVVGSNRMRMRIVQQSTEYSLTSFF